MVHRAYGNASLFNIRGISDRYNNGFIIKGNTRLALACMERKSRSRVRVVTRQRGNRIPCARVSKRDCDRPRLRERSVEYPLSSRGRKANSRRRLAPRIPALCVRIRESATSVRREMDTSVPSARKSSPRSSTATDNDPLSSRMNSPSLRSSSFAPGRGPSRVQRA